MSDLRYTDILRRLSLLTNDQLQRILLEKPDEICLDTYNYNSETQTFCPLAIALDIPKKCEQESICPTQETVLDMIREELGEAWGTVKGVSGEFYTSNRYEDLMLLCQKIIYERGK